MSELEQDRPLTRRERRLLEMVATGAVPTVEAAAEQVRETASPEERARGPRSRRHRDRSTRRGWAAAHTS
ncbi:hypothetical protein [Leucobacter soli]|uniref:hypothetical protein n=1 Tax=Leucobacter soli TaxID=2812850 RepID=UPI0036080D3F